jgi:hypothetical protein
MAGESALHVIAVTDATARVNATRALAHRTIGIISSFRIVFQSLVKLQRFPFLMDH